MTAPGYLVSPMPCLFFVLGAGAPRFVLALLWLLSAWFSAAFSSWLVPLLGFLFAPLSTIWYAVVQHYYGGAWTLWPMVGMALAIAIDLGIVGGGARQRARRR